MNRLFFTFRTRALARSVFALLVAGGLSASAHAAPRWAPIGPVGGVVSRLAQAPSDLSRLYASTYPSGLFRSRDGGSSWKSIDRGFEGAEVHGFDVDPRDPDVLLIFTQTLGPSPSQVWRSEDGGATWEAAKRPPQDQNLGVVVNEFLFDAADSRTVYAATTRRNFRSRDGGLTWDPWGSSKFFGIALAQDPNAPAVFFLSARPDTGDLGGIYRSTDGGTTWTQTPSEGGPGFQGLPARLFFRDGALFAVWAGALYRSTDGALSWSVAARLPTLSANDFRFAPSGGIYAATFSGVYFSTDGFRWTPSESTSVVRASPGDSIVGVAPMAGGTVVAAGRRGAWRSTDRGAIWRAASRGLAARIVGSFAVLPNPQGTVIGSFEDGLFRTERGESAWRRLPRQAGFLAPVLAADPHRPGRTYALGDTDLGVSDDLGSTWRKVGALRHDFAHFLRVDPGRPNVLYAGVEIGFGSSANGFAYRSSDGGATWTEILAFDYLLDMTFDPAHPNVAWRATFSGIDKTTDGGVTWTPLPNVRSQILFASPSSLLYEPVTRTLYLGTDQRGVFRSTDGGRTFRRLVGGLPRRPGGMNPYVATLLLDPAGTIYAGLDQAGVFMLAEGRRWTGINAGLPLPTFHGRLAADPARAGLLYAGSIGSSVHRLENR